MRRAVVGLVASAAVVTPALADNGKEEARMRKVASVYATCVVRKHHDKASEAILAMASNHTIIHDMTQIIDPDCLDLAVGRGVSMHFPADTYRFALADALVNADYATHEDASFADRLPLAQPHLVPPDEEEKRLANAKGARRRAEALKALSQQNALTWMSIYGECVVRQDPVDARYWLLTPAESPEETSRIKAMQPALSACLDNGMLRFTRTMVRGTVAVNYYRLAKATVMPVAGSEH